MMNRIARPLADMPATLSRPPGGNIWTGWLQLSWHDRHGAHSDCVPLTATYRGDVFRAHVDGELYINRRLDPFWRVDTSMVYAILGCVRQESKQ